MAALPAEIEAGLRAFQAQFDFRGQLPPGEEFEWAAAHLLSEEAPVRGARLIEAERRGHARALWELAPRLPRARPRSAEP